MNKKTTISKLNRGDKFQMIDRTSETLEILATYSGPFTTEFNCQIHRNNGTSCRRRYNWENTTPVVKVA